MSNIQKRYILNFIQAIHQSPDKQYDYLVYMTGIKLKNLSYVSRSLLKAGGYKL